MVVSHFYPRPLKYSPSGEKVFLTFNVRYTKSYVSCSMQQRSDIFFLPWTIRRIRFLTEISQHFFQTSFNDRDCEESMYKQQNNNWTVDSHACSASLIWMLKIIRKNIKTLKTMVIIFYVTLKIITLIYLC